MKSSDKDQELFDALRQSPTEIDLDRVESIIKGLPDLPVKPFSKNNWNHFFNLNSILMLSIPIILLLSVTLFFNGPETPETTMAANELVEQPQAPLEAPTEVSIPVSEVDIPQKKEPESINENITEPKGKPILNGKTIAKIKEVDQPKIEATKTKDSPLTESAASTSGKAANSTKPQGVAIQAPRMTSDETKIKFSERSLRRLKRVLLKNLKADGLAGKPNYFTELHLTKEGVLIEGQVLNAELAMKYRLLTKEGGYGPNRYLKLSKDFIRIGDFTEEGCLNGMGIGTFQEDDFKSVESILFEKEEKLEKERRGLLQRNMDDFSNSLMGNERNLGGSKSPLFVNLKGDDIMVLHRLLYEQLLGDGLISSAQDFALFQLPKGEIVFNGENLEGALAEKYLLLFKEYKVGHGPIRQVRLTEVNIRAGDFKVGSFTGTSWEE